jgi:type I restriction enzyme R subunit
MAYTDINSEDRLVQATFAEHLEKVLGWDSVYAWNQETFGPVPAPWAAASEREVVLVRDLRSALVRLNPHCRPRPSRGRGQAHASRLFALAAATQSGVLTS